MLPERERRASFRTEERILKIHSIVSAVKQTIVTKLRSFDEAKAQSLEALSES